MRLCRLYTNRPEAFVPISFRRGLNVIVGEIRLPENRTLSVHNLGKTTLARVIDFCLCRGTSKEFFLQKHADRFEGFGFYLELELLDGRYVTIRRTVEAPSKLSIVAYAGAQRDFSDADESEWDHVNVGIELGKQILDGLFGLNAVKPWDFRIPVAYALRTQSDFTDVFRLSTHLGKHRYWKPYIAHILGFDATLVEQGFDLIERIERLKSTIATLRLELGGTEIDLDQIRGLIDIKKKDVDSLEAAANRFDFAIQDSKVNARLVEELDEQIASLNNQRYTFSRTRRRIQESLQAEHIQFRPEMARRLFEEAGVVFPGQVVKEFEDLVRFNQEVSNERIAYLRAELEETTTRLSDIAQRLEGLNQERQTELQYLGDMESISKYREMNQRLVAMKNELASLERQRDALLGIREKEKEFRILVRQREDQVDALRTNVDACGTDKAGRYWRIREALADLCQQFLGHKALVTTRLNKEDNIEFQAEYLDLRDHATSESEGKSYKQLLCAAFDLAVTRVMLDDAFVRFVFHDGLLEGLDNRIKLNVISGVRSLADMGIQQILTVIDSDLPITDDGQRFAFHDDEVVLTLHDEGAAGRLFHMDSW